MARFGTSSEPVRQLTRIRLRPGFCFWCGCGGHQAAARSGCACDRPLSDQTVRLSPRQRRADCCIVATSCSNAKSKGPLEWPSMAELRQSRKYANRRRTPMADAACEQKLEVAPASALLAGAREAICPHRSDRIDTPCESGTYPFGQRRGLSASGACFLSLHDDARRRRCITVTVIVSSLSQLTLPGLSSSIFNSGMLT